MMEPNELRNALSQFTGTENWYRHGIMRSMLMTDGVKFLADTAGAHWLTDIVASWQLKPKVRRELFQVWKLLVRQGDAPLSYEIDGGKKRYVSTEHKAVVIMTDGNSNTPVVTQNVSYTDFPLDAITLYAERGEYLVLMLPGER